jgi:hypothetical protein
VEIVAATAGKPRKIAEMRWHRHCAKERSAVADEGPWTGRETHTMKTLTLILAVVATATLPALAGDTPDHATIRGEVVASRLAPATAQEGRCLEVQVRRHNQERTWVRLGPVDEMNGKFQNGDRIRARVMNQQGSDVALARDVRNETTGAQMRLRDRDRLRDGTGDGQADRDRVRDRSRDRIHTPGTGGGNGSGARRGGR